MSDPTGRQSAISEFFGGFLSIFRGLGVTFGNLVGRRKITELYPYEKPIMPPRYRGLFYLPYDAGAERLKCVGCTLCEQACPTRVISMTKLGTGKHAGVNEFTMDLGRCMFCNLCIEACPFDAIYMGPAYELASTHRDASVFRIEDLAQGGQKAVLANNETISKALLEEAAKKAAAAAAPPSASPKHNAHAADPEPAV